MKKNRRPKIRISDCYENLKSALINRPFRLIGRPLPCILDMFSLTSSFNHPVFVFSLTMLEYTLQKCWVVWLTKLLVCRLLVFFL